MYGNALLDALPGEAQLLRNRLTPMLFAQGETIAEAGAPARHLIFPRSGLLSLLVEFSDGERVEVGMVGSDGALGCSPLLTAAPSICKTCALLPTRAWLMKSADAAEAAKHSSEFSRLLYVQERWLHAQAQQIAACNVRHTIMQRLCCWLLRAYDLAEGGELLVTQEHLGQILGVQRASICLCASRLQEQALIQYRRGHLRILDKDRLAEHACECHHVLRRMRKLLMHGDAPRASAQRDLARALQ